MESRGLPLAPQGIAIVTIGERCHTVPGPNRGLECVHAGRGCCWPRCNVFTCRMPFARKRPKNQALPPSTPASWTLATENQAQPIAYGGMVYVMTGDNDVVSHGRNDMAPFGTAFSPDQLRDLSAGPRYSRFLRQLFANVARNIVDLRRCQGAAERRHVVSARRGHRHDRVGRQSVDECRAATVPAFAGRTVARHTRCPVKLRAVVAVPRARADRTPRGARSACCNWRACRTRCPRTGRRSRDGWRSRNGRRSRDGRPSRNGWHSRHG